MKKYQSFSSGNVQDLEVKFSIYLHRRVFVMKTKHQRTRKTVHMSQTKEKTKHTVPSSLPKVDHNAC